MTDTRWYDGDADDYDAPVYVISVAAELADMHPQTLRGYERKGLIEPARTEGNTRRYSRRDIDKLSFIQNLTQEQGLNLAGVKAVLEMGERLRQSQQRVRELEEMVRALAGRLQDDVDAAHRSHRFEVVPVGRSDLEVHSAGRRTAARPRVQRATPVPPPEDLERSELERDAG